MTQGPTNQRLSCLPVTCAAQELIRHVYGFSIEAMHGEVPEMTEQIRAAKDALLKMSAATVPALKGPSEDPNHEDERTMRSDHLRARFKAGKYYSLSMLPEKTKLAFQCVCVHPGRRAYVQRICCLGRDDSRSSLLGWLVSICCSVLFGSSCRVSNIKPKA